MYTNRMRNIHAYIVSEYGKENMKTFWQWEKTEMKMAHFQNHRRFSLRCLSKDIIPVSVKLRHNVKAPKGNYIVRKAEKALLNEGMRSINNTITMFKYQIDTCIGQLKIRTDKKMMEDFYIFIMNKRESRHLKTLERQGAKFERLCHKNTGGCSNIKHGRNGNGHSNTSNVPSDLNAVSHISTPNMTINTRPNNNNWVRNFSKAQLTKAQEQVLAHGPNFAVVSKQPAIGEYAAAVEKACQQLKQGEAEELRGENQVHLKEYTSP